jgi:hypothetical protein
VGRAKSRRPWKKKMINRRGMLKLIGSAPVAAPAIVAGLAGPVAETMLISPSRQEYFASLGPMTWSRGYDLEAGDYVDLGLYEGVTKIAGAPVYDPRDAVEEVDTVSAGHAPYHPEMMAV